MKRIVKIAFYGGDGYEDTAIFETEKGYSMSEENGLLYILIDDKARLVLNKDRFISMIEEKSGK